MDIDSSTYALWTQKMEYHKHVSEIVERVEQEVECGQSHGSLATTAEIVRLGALRFWISTFLDICHSRWIESFDSSVESHNDYTIDECLKTALVLPLMTDLNRASQCKDWNHLLVQCIRHYRIANSLGVLTNSCSTSFVGDTSFPGATPRSPRIFLSVTYLPRFAEFSLAIACKTLPRRWQEPQYDSQEIDISSRDRLSFAPENAQVGSFEHFARLILPYSLPKSMVEDLPILIESLKGRRLRAFQTIFTANLHVASDSFLIWLALSKMNGTKVLLSQHGGLNGQGMIPTRCEEFEQKFADRYLHWGWSGVPHGVKIPAQINVWRLPRQSHRKDIEVLLITDCTYRFNRRPWSAPNDGRLYRELVFDTYRMIRYESRIEPTVRLHHDYAKYDDSFLAEWKERFPEAVLDEGTSRISRLRRRTRLAICTTLGTSELEQFALEIPTILRLDFRLHMIRSESKSVFEDMESVGLVHWSNESLRKFLEQHHGDLELWWKSLGVRKVVDDYMEKFAFRSQTPLRDLKRALRL